MIKEIIFATNNLHKLQEVQHLLGTTCLIRGLSEMGCTEDIPEPFHTLEENAVAKAAYISEKYKLNCFADDTGLEVEALHGEPGVLSARYAGEEKDPQANMTKLLRQLQGVKNRKARFRTVIAFVAGNETKLFEGMVEGVIIHEKKGSMGFGYDPIFLPDGYTQTFAEMPLDLKNMLSHRARAMTKFIHYLQEQNKPLADV